MVLAPTPNASLFASDVNAPRRRRPSDVFELVVGAVGVTLLLWAADRGVVAIDRRTAAFFGSPPSWLEWIATIAYAVTFLYAVGLVVATLVRGGIGRGVLRDVLVAVATTAAVGFIGEGIVYGRSWPDVMPELFAQPGEPAFPAFRVALVLTVVSVQAPYLTSPVRRIGRWMIGAAAVSTLFLGYSSITGVAAAMCTGVAVVAAVRLVFGSPEGLPPVGRLRDVLARMGIDVDELSYDADQTDAVGRARAVDHDGTPLRIKVYGRDAADAQWADRVWSALWYRHTGPSVATGRLRQVQHEALGLLLAERSGVGTAGLRTAGLDDNGDAVLVTVDAPVPSLHERSAAEVTDADLDALWAALRTLHAERLAHGALDPWSIHVQGGQVALSDFQEFTVSASDARLQADRVMLLATTVGVVGDQRAVDAMVRTVGQDSVEHTLPYLQSGVLPRRLDRWLDDREVDIDSLRESVVERSEVEPPELAKLRRVSPGGVVMALFGVFAANAIVSQIAEIGFDTLLDELSSASPGWLVAAFVIQTMSNLTSWLSLQAMIDEPVPIGPTTLLQSAKSFVGMVVPSTLGRVAMDVRFLQRMGTPTTVAVAQGPLIGFVGFLIETAMLLLTVGSMSEEIDTDEMLSVDVGGLILFAVGLTAIGIVVVLAVRPIRQRIIPPLLEAYAAVRNVVVHPSRIGRVFGGEILDRLASALMLACVLAAYGTDLAFPVVIFVTIGTKLLAGIAPVPGGVGVAEALLTALLTAAGLPPDQAFAVAITYRLVGSYIPPALGFFSLRWLKRHRYL